MTQEEKIKDLEERIAIMQASDSALCTDLEHWKKVASGLKGRNKQLKFANEELQREMIQKTDLLSVANESITAYRTQLHETNATLESYKRTVEWYNKLPWWKKVFVQKILL